MSDMVKLEEVTVRVDLYEHPMVDVAIGSLNDCLKFAEVLIKKHSRFTDGGTPKKQVQKPVKIPEDKKWKFSQQLLYSARKQSGIDDFIGFLWTRCGPQTVCKITYDGVIYFGTTMKHPEDVENEYKAKSKSFNRALAKLVDAVNGVSEKECVGVATGAALRSCTVHVRLHDGSHCIARAGKDVNMGDRLCTDGNGHVYPVEKPKKSERPFTNGGYSGGRVNLNFESMRACSPEWSIPAVNPNTKSECTDKESDKESDDITITMSREEAEDLRKYLRKHAVGHHLYHKLGRTISLSR